MGDAFNVGSGGYSMGLVSNFFYFLAAGLIILWWVWILASIFQASQRGTITKQREFNSYLKVNIVAIFILIFISFLKTA